MANWDHEVDFLIVGSGSGAMTAALTAYDRGAKPLLIEKTDRYGGSSAMSGGGLWVPCNHLMDSVGIKDNPEDAWTYLKGTVGDVVPEDRLRAYLKHSPEMVKYLMDHTQVHFVALPEYADYYPNVAGSRPGGRCIEPDSFHAGCLGDEFLRLREQNVQMLIMNRIFMTVLEARILLTKAPGANALTMKLMGRYWFDLPWRFKSKRDRNLAMGNALIGMLRRSMMDRGIPLWLNTPAKELVVEGGRVVGVVAEKEGRPMRIGASKGVLLASGGFEGSQEMREKYLPKPTKVEWSCANKKNTGDGINMGLKVGAAIDLMDDGWWGPSTLVPGEEHARILVIEKSLPGGIIVNKKGERFVNEASAYIDVVNAMYAKNLPGAESVPAYLIFDATFLKKYPVGPLLPGGKWPRIPNYLVQSDTIEGLAAQVGIDAAGLKATVTKFNGYAQTGKDPDFNRGETVFDKYYGDANVKPNPCLGPIEKPPFYCLITYPGELGTKGGLKADARARVLNEAGQPIPGLYATGNTSAAAMGRTYPGAGATIGPSMTFGYIAALDAIPK